jgi:hypothetical protein
MVSKFHLIFIKIHQLSLYLATFKFNSFTFIKMQYQVFLHSKIESFYNLLINFNKVNWMGNLNF